MSEGFSEHGNFKIATSDTETAQWRQEVTYNVMSIWPRQELINLESYNRRKTIEILEPKYVPLGSL